VRYGLVQVLLRYMSSLMAAPPFVAGGTVAADVLQPFTADTDDEELRLDLSATLVYLLAPPGHTPSPWPSVSLPGPGLAGRLPGRGR
jgi:hypothetical protein